MKKYGGVDVKSYVFLSSALVGDEWSASWACRITLFEIAPSLGFAQPLTEMSTGNIKQKNIYGE
jgi:hypothetical protein